MQKLSQTARTHQTLTVRPVLWPRGFIALVRTTWQYAELELYRERQEKMADPQIASNPTEFQRIATAAAELQPVVDAYRQLKEAEKELQGAKAVLRDSAGTPTRRTQGSSRCCVDPDKYTSLPRMPKRCLHRAAVRRPHICKRASQLTDQLAVHHCCGAVAL